MRSAMLLPACPLWLTLFKLPKGLCKSTGGEKLQRSTQRLGLLLAEHCLETLLSSLPKRHRRSQFFTTNIGEDDTTGTFIVLAGHNLNKSIPL